jgi:hypothetical protein
MFNTSLDDELIVASLPVLDEDLPHTDHCHHGSAANCHVFHDRTAFEEYNSITPLSVKGFGHNLSTVAVGCGSVRLRCNYGGRTYSILLTNVLLGIRTGNPRVLLGNPYPTHTKPLPALTAFWRVWVRGTAGPVGYHGSATHANSTVFVQQSPSPPITPPYLPGTTSSSQCPHVSTTPRIVSRATTQNDPSSAEQAWGNASPLKTFVHGVMHFSRTSLLYAPAGPRATQMLGP